MLWLAHYNLEINQRTEEVKMTRCLEKCRKQQRSKQGKSGWEKQKEEEKKKKEGRKQKEKGQKKKKKKPRKERIMEVKKVVEEWEIWDKEEEAAKLEEEAKKLILEHFHKWIHVFGKKASERIFTRKL